jgi:hypothetical protein
MSHLVEHLVSSTDLLIVMTALDTPCAWWDGGSGDRFFRRLRLEDAMRGFHTLHLPHLQHFSAHSALVSAREKLSDHSIEITMAFAILFGVLMVLTFWAVIAR